MLVGKKVLKPYPNKSVIEDVLFRVGPPTESSFTPFAGENDLIGSQFSGRQMDDYDETMLRSYIDKNNYDFNPRKCNGKPGKYLEDYIVNGEELPEIRRWSEQVIIGFKTNSGSDYRKYRLRTVERLDTRKLTDDDESCELKDILTKERDLSNEEYIDLVNEASYLIKNIWYESKSYGSNIFSFLFAYYKIRKDKNSRNVTVNDFSNYDLYQLKDGSQTKYDHKSANKYKDGPYNNTLDIFTKTSITNAHVFNMCMRYIDVLQYLNVDILSEDPLRYNEENIGKIICTYILTNDQYTYAYQDIDVEILKALAPENIYNTPKHDLFRPMYEEHMSEDTILNIVKDTFDLVYDKVRMDPSEFMYWPQSEKNKIYDLKRLIIYNESISNECLNLIVKAVFGKQFPNAVYKHKSIELGLTSYKCGFDTLFRLTTDGSPIEFPGEILCPFADVGTDYKFYITENGFALYINMETANAYYVEQQDVIECLSMYLDGEPNEKDYWKLLSD